MENTLKTEDTGRWESVEMRWCGVMLIYPVSIWLDMWIGCRRFMPLEMIPVATAQATAYKKGLGEKHLNL